MATIKYPIKYPITTWKYVNCDSPTHPGTEIKVTPERDAPTIPNATIYHGDSLLPEKNVLLSLLPLVSCDTRKSREKYNTTIVIINDSDINIVLV